jgi:hypothetical protein
MNIDEFEQAIQEKYVIDKTAYKKTAVKLKVLPKVNKLNV